MKRKSALNFAMSMNGRAMSHSSRANKIIHAQFGSMPAGSIPNFSAVGNKNIGKLLMIRLRTAAETAIP